MGGSSVTTPNGNISCDDFSNLSYDKLVYSMTKICWLNNPLEALKLFLLDDASRKSFIAYAKESLSPLVYFHLTFFDKACQIRFANTPQLQLRLIRQFHMQMAKNAMFYCTTNEIIIGKL